MPQVKPHAWELKALLKNILGMAHPVLFGDVPESEWKQKTPLWVWVSFKEKQCHFLRSERYLLCRSTGKSKMQISIMVQKSHWKLAPIRSLENTDNMLILVLPPLSLAKKDWGYFPANQLNQKARTWDYQVHRSHVYTYSMCVLCLLPAPLGGCGRCGCPAEKAKYFVLS